MRLNLLPFSASAEGYFQRMVLDTPTRNGLRVLCALVCLFGSRIFVASVGAALHLQFLEAISNGLWLLMCCIFIGAWVSGAILSVWQMSKGRTFNWSQALKAAQSARTDRR